MEVKNTFHQSSTQGKDGGLLGNFLRMVLSYEVVLNIKV